MALVTVASLCSFLKQFLEVKCLLFLGKAPFTFAASLLFIFYSPLRAYRPPISLKGDNFRLMEGI